MGIQHNTTWSASSVWTVGTRTLTAGAFGSVIGYQGSLGATTGYVYQPASGKVAILSWARDDEMMSLTNYDGVNNEYIRENNSGAGSFGGFPMTIGTNTRYTQLYNNDGSAHDISYTGWLLTI